ncbi:MAG: DegT/DnrJ/EryC1/StrS family aminotransferase [Sphaerotilus natans subsp. sulfidivorans]|uniref:DegT/DnrJ/EryC1/StrS family aminotransferase n=1 Tax=Sphaerotilus sulfidivorans TaxID=639200 RepID=UPI002352DCFA|nr:DegT/DnrJ/EryC1/StrS family aminotransferase [Sphaerotilus sulfidivorans]MCK6403039.1 DegT/DnrJ/EryC1/StrS family aminotransferase [Sphaerotilus sulfidivorans]
MVTSIPLFDCRLDASDLAALEPVLASGQLAAGPNVAGLEQDLAAYLGGGHVVALGDMTHALTLALQLAGIGPGDEVLTLAYNCLSSNTAITHAGAVPVWVDIDPEQAVMSLADCEAALTPKTRALIVYHVAGYPAPLDALRAFCDAHHLALIEDANNALGARWNGRPVGRMGDFAVFSFYANRQVNGIEGAALVCPDEATAREAQRLRRFGIDMSTFRDRFGEINPASDVPRIGMSSPLNHVNATLARHRLQSLDERLTCNRSHAAWLDQALADVDGIRCIGWSDSADPAFWVGLIRCARRDQVLTALKQQGIHCSRLHHPNDGYTGFGSLSRDLPGTRSFISEVLALPCGWWLCARDLNRIADAVRDAARLAD